MGQHGIAHVIRRTTTRAKIESTVGRLIYCRMQDQHPLAGLRPACFLCSFAAVFGLRTPTVGTRVTVLAGLRPAMFTWFFLRSFAACNHSTPRSARLFPKNFSMSVNKRTIYTNHLAIAISLVWDCRTLVKI